VPRTDSFTPISPARPGVCQDKLLFPSAGRLLNKAALSEAPRQLVMDFARRNVVITQSHEQMEQEIRRLMNDLLSLLSFGGQNHFACLLGDFLEDYILPCLEERRHVGIRRRKSLALEDRLINPF
jgi:hypothetical protein